MMNILFLWHSQFTRGANDLMKLLQISVTSAIVEINSGLSGDSEERVINSPVGWSGTVPWNRRH